MLHPVDRRSCTGDAFLCAAAAFKRGAPTPSSPNTVKKKKNAMVGVLHVTICCIVKFDGGRVQVERFPFLGLFSLTLGPFGS